MNTHPGRVIEGRLRDALALIDWRGHDKWLQQLEPDDEYDIEMIDATLDELSNAVETLRKRLPQ